MLSNDGFVVDTYTSPLTPKDALEFYGYDIIYMLYSAMKDYYLAEKEILTALNLTLGYIQKKSNTNSQCE
jgi:hypothetical protein